MENYKLVLASQSPRRIELLKMLGLEFEVTPAHIDESKFKIVDPNELVLRLSYEKAFCNWTNYNNQHIVLGADTIVYINDEILGKPQDKTDAMAMLNKLSNRWHKVVTGIALLSTDEHAEISAIQAYEETEVHFRKLDLSEIEYYTNTIEPYDKAGSYALQGLGGCFIDKINGCYANVIGLPLVKTVNALRQKGIKILG